MSLKVKFGRIVFPCLILSIFKTIYGWACNDTIGKGIPVIYYTPVFRRDVLWYGAVSPSVRPSVCPLTFRVRPVASTVQDGFFPYLVQMINSMRGCVACDDPWPWAISSRSFGLDLENRVCSVAYTVLDGFFLYLVQMITIIRGCVACYVFFRIWKFEFLANFWNFSAMTLKNKIYEWDLNCLVWVCCLNKVIAFLLSYFVLYNIVLYLTAIYWEYINCLKQDFSISNALAMEILQFCTN